MAGVSEAGRRIVSILVFGMLISLAAGATAFAQAGSTGGTIGKIDKSVSGAEEGTSREPRAKSRASHRASVRPRSEGPFWGRPRGSWAVSATPSCLPPWTLTTSVSNGVDKRRRRDRASFARAGAVRGNAVVLGLKFGFRRSLSRRTSVRELWSVRNGCPGHWTADKGMIGCRVSGIDHRHAVNLDHQTGILMLMAFNSCGGAGSYLA